MSLFNWKKSLTISEREPTYKVRYLGNGVFSRQNSFNANFNFSCNWTASDFAFASVLHKTAWQRSSTFIFLPSCLYTHTNNLGYLGWAIQYEIRWARYSVICCSLVKALRPELIFRKCSNGNDERRGLCWQTRHNYME
jgi:hypothetical protein